MNDQPLTSVIVPTKNSEEFLEKCLDSIKNQTYNNFEIIVVDNNSTDNTKEIARKYTNKVFEINDYFKTEIKPERSAQVNYGVNMASGEYIYKVDSDFILDKEVIAQCIQKINEGFDAVVVHNSPDVAGTPNLRHSLYNVLAANILGVYGNIKETSHF